VSISHTYREGNKATDFIADLGHSKVFGLHIIASSDANLGFFLRYDCMGVFEPMICYSLIDALWTLFLTKQKKR
ncbi:hypothetical protein LINPERPRIM_LOCUS13774, partial [Linum perenne]